MKRDQNLLAWLRAKLDVVQNKAITGRGLSYLFILVLSLLIISEVTGNPSPPIATGVSSALLSFMLVLLYGQQSEIMSNQEDIMEKEHDCLIVGYFDGPKSFPKVRLHNIGPSAAYDVTAYCDLGEEEVRIKAPLIPPQESVSKKIPQVDSVASNNLPKVWHMKEAIEDGSLKSEATIEITYWNSLHEQRTSKWDRNFESSVEDILAGEHQTPRTAKSESQ